MKKNIILGLLLGANVLWAQEVGINTNSPKAILEVVGNTALADSTSDAVIIPRVSSLNDADAKEVGLMVFLEKKKTDADPEARGFYWWDGGKWRPFLSTVQTSINRTITYIQAKKEFVGGNFSGNTGGTRNIDFDATTLRTPRKDDFLVVDGGLKIKRKGYYNVNASVVLLKGSGMSAKRDTMVLSLLLNGGSTSAKNNNMELIANNSFPQGDDIGNTIMLTGLIKLDVDDVLSLQVERLVARATGAATGSISVDPNADSNMTLQYIGDF